MNFKLYIGNASKMIIIIDWLFAIQPNGVRLKGNNAYALVCDVRVCVFVRCIWKHSIANRKIDID